MAAPNIPGAAPRRPSGALRRIITEVVAVVAGAAILTCYVVSEYRRRRSE